VEISYRGWKRGWHVRYEPRSIAYHDASQTMDRRFSRRSLDKLSRRSRILMHWMLLPLSVCGTIVGSDAVRWFRGRYTLFDPKGMIGLAGINFFVIAPLLIVINNMEGVLSYYLGR
jgi:GT2 family glycosyltransferase